MLFNAVDKQFFPVLNSENYKWNIAKEHSSRDLYGVPLKNIINDEKNLATHCPEKAHDVVRKRPES
jgi:hypothetical protein